MLIAVGCKKESSPPQPPIITFVSAEFNANKTASIIKFEFLDENGDLGLRQEENQGEQENNLFVDYYERINGEWVLKSPIITLSTIQPDPNTVKYDTTELNARFPFIENEDESALTGDAEIVLLYNPTIDTFRYEIYIKDRAFQKSNTLITPDMIVVK